MLQRDKFIDNTIGRIEIDREELTMNNFSRPIQRRKQIEHISYWESNTRKILQKMHCININKLLSNYFNEYGKCTLLHLLAHAFHELFELTRYETYQIDDLKRIITLLLLLLLPFSIIWKWKLKQIWAEKRIAIPFVERDISEYHNKTHKTLHWK